MQKFLFCPFPLNTTIIYATDAQALFMSILEAHQFQKSKSELIISSFLSL